MTRPKTLPRYMGRPMPIEASVLNSDVAAELRRMAIRMVSESKTRFALEWAERLRAMADRIEAP